MYICNAFSLQMLPKGLACDLRVEPITVEAVRALDLQSAIGHADTAVVVGNILGKEFAAERVNVSLDNGDSIIVAQVQGGRLPEGATTLPEGTRLVFLKVTVMVAF